MACSRAHGKFCSPAHARLVGEYRDARDARDALRESGILAPAEFGFGAMVAYYQLEDDDFARACPPVLFREWLVENSKALADPWG